MKFSENTPAYTFFCISSACERLYRTGFDGGEIYCYFGRFTAGRCDVSNRNAGWWPWALVMAGFGITALVDGVVVGGVRYGGQCFQIMPRLCSSMKYFVKWNFDLCIFLFE